MSLFSAIKLERSAEAYAFRDSDDRTLTNLSKINIFVGANNSGKSRLMREMMVESDLNIVPNVAHLGLKHGYSFYEEIFEDAKTQIEKIIADANTGELFSVSEKVNKFLSKRQVTEGQNPIYEGVAVLRELSNRVTGVGNLHLVNVSIAVDRIKNVASEAIEKLNGVPDKIDAIPKTKKIYIPTLRSLRFLGGEDPLGRRIKDDYFTKKPHVEIATGQNLYAEVEKLVRGDFSEREHLRKFEQWISKTFFEGQSVAIIPRIGSDCLTIKIGNEREQPIQNLGDGIQALLAITFPLFARSDECILAFIEEPELSLHPWLQRVFLETLSSSFRNHQYFLTTHSNHFLDMTLDIDGVSVFLVEKSFSESDQTEIEASYTVKNVSRDDRRPLELLGVRNSSVLLTNCTIWVEGITDRRYIAHWLKLAKGSRSSEVSSLANRFKEDLHYSFVEYSGANITHWSFLDQNGPDVEKLCGTLFLISDSDSAKPGTAKFSRHQVLSQKLEDRFYLTPGREIENLLTSEIIKLVLLSYGENESSLKTFVDSDFREKQLGKFIESKAFKKESPPHRRGKYATSSGTIADKTKFCEFAIESMTDFEKLSDEVRLLVTRILHFIDCKNR